MFEPFVGKIMLFSMLPVCCICVLCMLLAANHVHLRNLVISLVFVLTSLFSKGINTYWLKPNFFFNFWASEKVAYAESFNFYFLGFWASKNNGSSDEYGVHCISMV